MNLLEKTEEVIEKELCDHCLGRLFAQLGHGATNKERGKSLRVVYAMDRSGEERENVPGEPETCSLCGNIFDEVEKFADLILDEFEEVEYDTFLVGSRHDPEVVNREEELWTELDLAKTAEPIKTEMNREVGKIVQKKSGKEVDLEDPDVKAIIDTRFDTVETELTPLFVYGRYNKLTREIPQTEWVCRKCRGKGCEHCDYKGKMYETSVEEIIGEELRKMTYGEDFTLHGMGREDIDVKMLGNGRPFVMEIKDPLERDIDLERFEETVNQNEDVQINSTEITDRDKVVEIKQAAADKTYRAKVSFSEEVDGAKLKKVVEELRGKTISQRTPNRVSHRRSDKVRKREVKDIELEESNEEENTAEVRLKCEAGTYVKEIINGDESRTDPNISHMLDMGCEVVRLDVLAVHYP